MALNSSSVNRKAGMIESDMVDLGFLKCARIHSPSRSWPSKLRSGAMPPSLLPSLWQAVQARSRTSFSPCLTISAGLIFTGLMVAWTSSAPPVSLTLKRWISVSAKFRPLRLLRKITRALISSSFMLNLGMIEVGRMNLGSAMRPQR